MFTDVFHANAQDDQYHGMEGFSFSQLKLLPAHPEEFYGFHVAKPPLWPREETDAMRFGTKVHARLLEPDTFAERFPRSEPCYGILKSGKRAGQSCGASASMRTAGNEWFCGVHAKGIDCHAVDCLSDDDAVKIEWIFDSCRSDKKIRALLECPGDIEYSLFGTHAETGLKVRGRLDKVCRAAGGRIILDFKTFNNYPHDERLVSATFIQRCYYMQAAMYMDLMKAAGEPCQAFAFVFVRTCPPYNAVLWLVQEQDLLIGRRHNERALKDLQQRFITDYWHGSTFGEENTLHLPPWFYEKADADIDFSSDFSSYAESEL
jgi:hypothetical protein